MRQGGREAGRYGGNEAVRGKEGGLHASRCKHNEEKNKKTHTHTLGRTGQGYWLREDGCVCAEGQEASPACCQCRTREQNRKTGKKKKGNGDKKQKQKVRRQCVF